MGFSLFAAGSAPLAIPRAGMAGARWAGTISVWHIFSPPIRPAIARPRMAGAGRAGPALRRNKPRAGGRSAIARPRMARTRWARTIMRRDHLLREGSACCDQHSKKRGAQQHGWAILHLPGARKAADRGFSMFSLWRRRVNQTLSSTVAMPCPTPMHMVAKARLSPRSCISCVAVAISRAPLMPKG